MPGFQNAVSTGFGSAANRGKMAAAIENLRGHAGSLYPLVIGGEKIDTGSHIASTNPAYPQEVVGKVAAGDTAYADKAVATATAALQKWSARSPFERAEILRRAAGLLEERRFELAAQLVLEVGKNPIQADAEVTEAVDYCNYHAELVEQLAKKPRRRNVPGEENVLVYDPCGVCALIGPWDFPLALVAGMVSAAVGSGNTAILKPSSSAPVIAAKLVEIFQAARLPSGVLNYLPGSGEEVARHLVEHSAVHLVAFCGSQENALPVAEAAARVRPGQYHMKRTIIDSSAKNAIIVDHDVDVDEAVVGVLDSAFGFSGQKCTACSRVIVLAEVYEKFCAKLGEAAKVMLIGDPANPATVIGPVIDEQSKKRIAGYVEEGRKSAKVLFEASQEDLPKEGSYVAPVIFQDVDPKSPLAQEEIFGPVLCVLKADSFDHALALANDSMYALTGGIYSRSPAHIERARWEFRVGNLYINRRITGSQVDVQPYGGSKLSGDGARLGAVDYLLQYCMPRTISENTIRHGLTSPEEQVEVEV